VRRPVTSVDGDAQKFKILGRCLSLPLVSAADEIRDCNGATIQKLKIQPY
jgi:hypothetical protein